jgi:SRSO17 transposase
MPARIIALPQTFVKFYLALHVCFSKPQRRHFGVYVVGSIVCQKKHTLRALCDAVLESGAPCNLYRFLAHSPWHWATLNRRRWELVLETLPQFPPGKRGFLIIDDSVCAKTGKKMEGVGWLKGEDGKKNEFGHDVVTAHYVIDQWDFPVGIRPYFKEDWCRTHKVRFRTHNELAAQLIREFQPPKGMKTIVLFDAWYLNPTVVKAVRQRRFHWISRAKDNRVFREGQEKSNLSTLAAKLNRKDLQKVQIAGSSYLVYSVVVNLNTLGRTRILITWDAEKPNREPVFLATNLMRLSAQKVLDFYVLRWRIETFYRDVKQLLGFGDYQVLKAKAQKRHWHLVLTAYTLLRLQQYVESGSLTERPRSLGEQCQALRQHNGRELVQWICDELREGKSTEDICQALKFPA